MTPDLDSPTILYPLPGGVTVAVSKHGNRVVEVAPDTARKLHANPGPVKGKTLAERRAVAVERARVTLAQRDEGEAGNE